MPVPSEPLVILTLTFHTSPLYMGPNKLAAFPILPVEPVAIIKWAKEAELNLVWSILWEIPIAIDWSGVRSNSLKLIKNSL